MFDRYPPKSVIVGIDGSQAAIRAARWAADEVAGTDISTHAASIQLIMLGSVRTAEVHQLLSADGETPSAEKGRAQHELGGTCELPRWSDT